MNSEPRHSQSELHSSPSHGAGPQADGFGRCTGRAKPAASRRAAQSTPPYNPGLHQLVAGKRAWAEPLSEEATAQGFLGWHQRSYLPHFDVPGVTQFVTLRLGDALPASRRSEWEALVKIEKLRERRKQLEAYSETNPLKAGLALEPQAWLWSSARFRDEYGRLCLPATRVAPAGARSAGAVGTTT